MRSGVRATWNGAADFSAAIRRAVFSGLSSIGVSLSEPSSVIRQVIKVQTMALLCTRCGLIGAEVGGNCKNKDCFPEIFPLTRTPPIHRQPETDQDRWVNTLRNPDACAANSLPVEAFMV